MRYLLLLTMFLLLSGCARFGPADPTPTAAPTVVPVPTFTPTPEQPAPTAPEPATEETQEQPASNQPANGQAETQAEAAAEPAAEEQESTAPLLVPTPTPPEEPAEEAAAPAEESDDTPGAQEAGPSLVVSGEIVNVRRGPSTDYPVVGSASAGESFTPTGRNQAGDWWQVCCFQEEPGWLYGPLVDIQQGDAVALVTDIPPAPTATPAPVAAAEPAEPAPAEAAPQADAPAEEAPAQEAAPAAPYDPKAGTEGFFDPNAQYHLVGYRVIGYGENNGGVFNNGGQHMIFITVLDANGNGVDGAVVKNAIDDNINIVTGSKGPGKAEFEMFWDPYKLYVASDPSGPVTSQITNQMNTAYPHIPDIVGKIGPTEEEYAICPTLDDRCEPPFFHAHWSYEVIFQKVK